MQRTIKIYNSINVKLLVMMLILLAVAALAASAVNYYNLNKIYEKNFTERVLALNSVMANVIDGDEVKKYVDMLRDESDEFKARQVQFYYDREELYRLLEEDAPIFDIESVTERIESFHNDLNDLKSEDYWRTLNHLKQLKEDSKSKYIYVVADTDVWAEDGLKLYTYIFDAEDDRAFNGYDNDGLGTVNIGESGIDEIYSTKKPMEKVMYYKGLYGELYYAYSPVFDSNGEMVAAVGTDIELGEMYTEIRKSMILFSITFLLSIIVVVLLIYFMLRRFITKPLEKLTGTAQKLADGEVYTLVPSSTLRQRDEIGALAYAINEMSSVYQSMIKSTGNLFDAANVGKLYVRNDASNYKGDIKKVITQINETLDATTFYLNSFPESILIISRDFEIYFRNLQFSKYFGDMSALEFIGKVFAPDPENDPESSKQQFEEALVQENSNINIWIDNLCFSIVLQEIESIETTENSVLVIAIDITALMKETENAQAAAKAKSNFLSSMSHEIRTPMNAIIGMTKIAEGTEDISKLKYCLHTIAGSSEHLLNIINDVLDMSKIESGKFMLENAPVNIEKMLVKTCGIVIDSMEKKGQKFDVAMDQNLHQNYMGDELRLSQVLTNLLSNAVKFTPENGSISLSVEEVGQSGNTYTLRFTIADTGIGIKEENIYRLFNSFEQADGSITRQFGGTGLGLAISKSIIENMDGHIWVESEYGNGAKFIFEVKIECASHQGAVIFDGIAPGDLKLLFIESDIDVRNRFIYITGGFGVNAELAESADEAAGMLESANRDGKAYDVVFIECDMPGMSGLETVDRLSGIIDNSTIVMVTSLLKWHKIEKDVNMNGITGFITKPIMPSAVLDAIGDILDSKKKALVVKMDAGPDSPDLAGVNLLLVEDVELNREIFSALLNRTGISIEFAENGSVAVSKFKEGYEKFDIIIMDIEMPIMDGYNATQTIRALDIPKAKSIPIIAMTANVFKEDIEHCLLSGMNDHLAKPIDEKIVIEKIMRYTVKKGDESF